MGFAYVLSVVGLMSLGIGLFMLAPMAVSLFYEEAAWTAFFDGAMISSLLGGGSFWLFRDKKNKELNHRQGMAVVGLTWAAAAVLGGIPFYLSGDFTGFTDAVFESASGFTTTGASILTSVEAAGKGVLFWRSLTHWLGGMGFIVLSIAILPFVGVGGMQLYRAEVPSPNPDRLQPRIMDTAKVLWKVYFILTLAETALLMFGGLDWFDASCQAMATLATGGFSTKNASIAGFESAYVEWVVTLFMFLAGVNFSLHYFLFKGRPSGLWRDEEWRFYTAVYLGGTICIGLALYLQGGQGGHDAARLAAFQSATILTTTGFATTDYTQWPAFALAILLFFMFVGGSAGSTGGGPKCLRIMVVLKRAYLELNRLVHPRLFNPVKVGGVTVERGVVGSIWAFMGLYVATFAITGLALSAMGLSPVDAFSASIACLGNIGPGLGSVGPVGNYAHLPVAAKWLLSVVMIVGRLEIYTVLVLLLPEFWRR